MKLRFIGDVHGKMHKYLVIAKEADFTIQIGDMGFNYDLLEDLDSIKHKVLGGNHDNYEQVDGKFVNQTAHFLGDYGVYSIPNFQDMFFIRGGNSIDKKYRTKGVSWWPEEELTYSEGIKALEEYKQLKPEFVISHECPTRLIDTISTFKYWDDEPILPSMTANLLDAMFEYHQPKNWIFGHHHKKVVREIGDTVFRCLPELGYFDILK